MRKRRLNHILYLWWTRRDTFHAHAHAWRNPCSITPRYWIISHVDTCTFSSYISMCVKVSRLVHGRYDYGKLSHGYVLIFVAWVNILVPFTFSNIYQGVLQYGNVALYPAEQSTSFLKWPSTSTSLSLWDAFIGEFTVQLHTHAFNTTTTYCFITILATYIHFPPKETNLGKMTLNN